ncbi:CCA tRNA nucleotidyltransferase [Hansschlegelia zhihuaiae]|uniref:CCA tRNA nucleotidyltransferase n=1 Tax=Hansschlegelia zhihuaiae TaxID=405005 RepID=A0A4Q0MJA5_9HYPH|nr:CCA tRNA nucleotidyltransferase [Hansschlegelia zhihuaiae]RXF73525.1 CCA tRNA nucleotidyltransferase [Hansschlegelia zhihuaiae]
MSAETFELQGAGWLKRRPLADLLAALDRDGEEARVNGGAVRDALLGLTPLDVDIATTALPEETVRRVEAAGWKAVPTGLAHGTVTAVVDRRPFEVTTLRRDVETDGRRAVVAFTRDWAEDAMRRDLTINGLYLSRDGQVHDHVGGLADLRAGRVRFIGSARDRIREDYLRTLRFFRFHARFARGPIDPEGFAAAIAERDGLARLSAERVRAELLKLLVAPRAPETVAVMAGAGLFAPLIGGVPRPSRLARLAALDADAPDALLRLAALNQVVREDAERLKSRLRLSRREADRLAAIGDGGGPDPADGEQAARLALYCLGREAFRDRLTLAWAESGAPPDSAGWRSLLTLADRWTPPKFPVTARELLALGTPEGPLVGETLRCLEELWLLGDFSLPGNWRSLLPDLCSRAR